MCQNIEVLNINHFSDHRPVRATFIVSPLKKSRKNYSQYQNMTLNNAEEISMFKDHLKSYAQTSQLDKMENKTIQQCYDNIIQVINTSVRAARRQEKPNKTHKILTERTLTLLNRKRDLQKIQNKNRAMKNEITALYKLTRKYIKRDYAAYRYKIIEKHLNQTGSTKKSHKELRTSKVWIDSLKTEERTLNDRRDILAVATEFYKKLYDARTTTTVNKRELMDRGSVELNVPPIKVDELVREAKKLKDDKSPGADNITNEVLKESLTTLAVPLTSLFNRILASSETPIQWSESNIILIYKKGDPKNISNYRPISLLSCIYKLFSCIINQRLNQTLEASQPVEQAGFRKGYSTIDQIHTLELIIEKYQEKQRPLYIGFIDYQKAFDTLSHDSIWETLSSQKVEEAYIQVLKSIYSNSKSRVKLETAGPWFPVRRGVRQGDPISPKLFIAVLEAIISQLDWRGCGVKVAHKYLSHLRFADDLVLLSESTSELQYMIESLNKLSQEVGLEMNTSKTMVMTNYIKRSLTIDGKPLNYTDQYVYLGKEISFDRQNNELEVERRSQLTWNKYWSMKEVFKSHLPTKIKSKLLNSCLIPCLTYACQTWKFSNKVKNKIQTCQRGIERSMLNISKMQKIRHNHIRKITKATDALTKALSLKWKWAGHIARLQDQRWTKKVTAWNGPLGKRKVGRPYARWEDEIIKTAGMNWMRVAQSRDDWNSLEEAFTCRGDPADM